MSSSGSKKMKKAKSSGNVNKNQIVLNREKRESKLNGKVNINVGNDGSNSSSGKKRILKFQKDKSLTNVSGKDKSESSRSSAKKKRGSGSGKKRRSRDNDRPFKTSRTHEEDDAEKKRRSGDGNSEEKSSRRRNETDSEKERRRARRRLKGGGSSRKNETDSEKEKKRKRRVGSSTNVEGKNQNSTKNNVDSPKRTNSKRGNIKSSKSRRSKNSHKKSTDNSPNWNKSERKKHESDTNKKSSVEKKARKTNEKSVRKDNDSSGSNKKSSVEKKSQSKSSARSGKNIEKDPIQNIENNSDQKDIFERKISRKDLDNSSGDKSLSIDISSKRKSDDHHRLSTGKRSARLSIDKKSSRRKSDQRLSSGRSRRSSDDKRASTERNSTRKKSGRKSARRRSDRKSARRKSGRKSGEDSSSDKITKELKPSLPEVLPDNEINTNDTTEDKKSVSASKSIKRSSKHSENKSGRKSNENSSGSNKKAGKKSTKHKKSSETKVTADAISKKPSRGNIGFQTSTLDSSGKRRRQSDIIIQSPSLKGRKRTSVGANSGENSPLYNTRTMRVGSGAFITEKVEEEMPLKSKKSKKHSNSFDTKYTKGRKPSRENRESLPNSMSPKREHGHQKKSSFGSVNEFQKGDYLHGRKAKKSGSKREKVSSGEDNRKAVRNQKNRRASSNPGVLKLSLNRRSVNLSTAKLAIKNTANLDFDVNIEKRFKTSREHREHKEKKHKHLKPGKNGPSPRSADAKNNMSTQSSSEQVGLVFSPVIQSTVIDSNTGITVTVDQEKDHPRAKRERLIDPDLWTTSQQHTPSIRRRMTEHDIVFPTSTIHSFVGSQQSFTLFDIFAMKDEKKRKLRKCISSTELGCTLLNKRRFLRRTISNVNLSEMTKEEMVIKSENQNKTRAMALGFKAPNRPPPSIPMEVGDRYSRPEDEDLASFLEHPVHFKPVKEYSLEEGGIVYDVVEIYGEIDSKIITRGTPESLITQLAGMEQMHLKDLDYTTSILSTYPYFISSEELLDAIILRFAHEPPNQEDEEMVKLYRRWRFTVRKTIRLVIELWLSDYIHYFVQDINLLDKLHAFINEEMGAVRPEWPGELMTIMNSKLEETHRSNELHTMLLKYMDPKIEILEELPVKSSRKKSKIPFLKYSARKIAYQLTIIENTLYSAINPDELLRAKWKKPNKQELAPNICNCIQWFNDLTTWVQYVILSQSEIKYRAQVLSHFISIVNECLALKNFNSIWAIISAMNQTPVSRLTFTWAILTTKEKTMFETCTDVMSSEHNFSTYRELNTYIMEQAKQREDTSEPISTPYLGLVCQDLLLVDELPTRLDDKINIKKLRRIAGTISDFRKQIKGTFHTPVDMSFVLWLLASRHESSKCDLYELSYICEPRGAKQ